MEICCLVTWLSHLQRNGEPSESWSIVTTMVRSLWGASSNAIYEWTYLTHPSSMKDNIQFIIISDALISFLSSVISIKKKMSTFTWAYLIKLTQRLQMPSNQLWLKWGQRFIRLFSSLWYWFFFIGYLSLPNCKLNKHWDTKKSPTHLISNSHSLVARNFL